MFENLFKAGRSEILKFFSTTKDESKAREILRNLIYDHFGARKIDEGTAGVYLFKPYESKNDYTAEEREVLGQILEKAAEKKEITAANVYEIVWVLEYDFDKKACLEFFPVDRSLVMEIDEIEKLLKTNRVIRLT